MTINPDTIKSLRVKKGLTQDDVAIKLGMSRTNYLNIENDPMKMKMYLFIKLVEIFDCTINDLFD